MKKRIPIILPAILGLLLGLSVWSVPASSQTPQPGLVLYQPYDETGRQFAPQMMVANTTGALGHLSLSLVLENGQPTPLAGRAIFQSGDNVHYLVDLSDGSAAPLKLPADAQHAPKRFYFNGPWAFAHDRQNSAAYLLNLESGQSTPLISPADEAGGLEFGQFSPDGRYLLFSANGQVRLVPTANPNAGRLLGRQNSAGAAFSSNGRQVLYQQTGSDGQVEIVLEPVEGGEPKRIAVGPTYTQAAWVPGQPQALINRPGQLALLTLETGQEQSLISDASPGPFQFRFGPNARTVLVSQGAYFARLLDLQQGSAQPLDSLNGHEPVAGRDELYRWVYFKDFTGSSYLSLDMTTGEVRRLLALEGISSGLGEVTPLPPDGRRALVKIENAFGPDQLWLLSADGSPGQLLAKADRVQGSVSPDNGWVAVSRVDYTPAGVESGVELVEFAGAQTVSLGQGFGAIWVEMPGKLAALNKSLPATPPVEEPFAPVWRWLGQSAGRLGPPAAPAVAQTVAWQRFEGGLLHWGWPDAPGRMQIHALLGGQAPFEQRWQRVADTFTEGDPPYPCPESGPPLGPRRGFGQVWCQQPSLREALGKPLAEEWSEPAGFQNFRNGVMLHSPAEESVYLLFNNGDWWKITVAEISARQPLWQSWPELGADFKYLAAAPDGAVWAVGPTHLARFEGEAWQQWPAPAGWSPDSFQPGNLAATANGDVWLGAGQVYRFDGSGWTPYGPAEGLPDEPIKGIAADAGGRLWAISSAVLNRFEGDGWQAAPVPDSPRLTGLAVTPDGVVWLAIEGSAAGGVYQFDGQNWTLHSRANRPQFPGAQYGPISIAAGGDNVVWAGTDQGWARWNSQQWELVQSRIPAPFSYPVAVDAAGGVWGPALPESRGLNLNETGVVYHNFNIACRFTAADGLNGPPFQPMPDFRDSSLLRPDRVSDIATAPDGSVWFIAGGQIAAFRPVGPACNYANPAWVRVSP